MNATSVNCTGLCMGGLVSNDYSSVSVSNSSFSGISGLRGGALCATNSFLLVNVSSTNITGCSASFSGGGMYVDDV